MLKTLSLGITRWKWHRRGWIAGCIKSLITNVLPGFPAMAHPMMEWVLETHYSHLFHQADYAEESIIVVEGIESQLIDLMYEVLQKYPEVKVFSLPKLKRTSASCNGLALAPMRASNMKNCYVRLKCKPSLKSRLNSTAIKLRLTTVPPKE